MADGWRNRYMAPVYALMISFGIVALSGALLEQSAPASSARPITVRFLGQDGKPSLAMASRNIFTADGESVGEADQGAEFRSAPTDEAITVCAYLPGEWTSREATKKLNRNLTCWGPIQPGAVMDVHVGTKG